MIGALPRGYVRKPDHHSEKSFKYDALSQNERTTRSDRAGNPGQNRAGGARAESRDGQLGLPQRQPTNVRSKPQTFFTQILSMSGHEVRYVFFFCRPPPPTQGVAAIST